MKEGKAYLLYGLLFCVGLATGVSTARAAGGVNLPAFRGCMEYGLYAFLSGKAFLPVLLEGMRDAAVLYGIAFLCALGKASFAAFPVFVLGKGFKTGCAVTMLLLSGADFWTVLFSVALLIFFLFACALLFARCLEAVKRRTKRKEYISGLFRDALLGAILCAFYALLLVRFCQPTLLYTVLS